VPAVWWGPKPKCVAFRFLCNCKDMIHVHHPLLFSSLFHVNVANSEVWTTDTGCFFWTVNTLMYTKDSSLWRLPFAVISTLCLPWIHKYQQGVSRLHWTADRWYSNWMNVWWSKPKNSTLNFVPNPLHT